VPETSAYHGDKTLRLTFAAEVAANNRLDLVTGSEGTHHP